MLQKKGKIVKNYIKLLPNSPIWSHIITFYTILKYHYKDHKTADKYLKKGLNRPIFSEETRMSFLSSIKEIDAVFLVKDPTALPAIEAIKPDFYFKGKDYLKGEDLSGNFIKEKNKWLIRVPR